MTLDGSRSTEGRGGVGTCGARQCLGASEGNSGLLNREDLIEGIVAYMMAQLKDDEAKQKIALQVPLTSQGLSGHGRAQNPGPSSGNQPLGWGVLVAAGNMASGMSSKGWAKWGRGVPQILPFAILQFSTSASMT